MAKRFTDTDIWNKAWFRRLPPRLKETWRFLCDKCDHAGIWEIDMDSLNFHVNDTIEFEEIFSVFGERVFRFDDEKLFIPGFIDFQYKVSVKNLNQENRVHKSVLERLKKYGLDKQAPSKPLKRPLQGCKDKEKDKDKETDKDKEAFEKWWNIYPKRNGRRIGKNEAKEKFKKIPQNQWNDLKTATTNYETYLNESGLSACDAKRFLNGAWKEYIEEANNQSKSFTEMAKEKYGEILNDNRENCESHPGDFGGYLPSEENPGDGF